MDYFEFGFRFLNFFIFISSWSLSCFPVGLLSFPCCFFLIDIISLLSWVFGGLDWKIFIQRGFQIPRWILMSPGYIPVYFNFQIFLVGIGILYLWFSVTREFKRANLNQRFHFTLPSIIIYYNGKHEGSRPWERCLPSCVCHVPLFSNKQQSKSDAHLPNRYLGYVFPVFKALQVGN